MEIAIKSSMYFGCFSIEGVQDQGHKARIRDKTNKRLWRGVIQGR